MDSSRRSSPCGCSHSLTHCVLQLCSFGAGHTFDGMSERLNYEEKIETAVGGEDGIGTLPDELLQTR